jgi:hypothetical protein
MTINRLSIASVFTLIPLWIGWLTVPVKTEAQKEVSSRTEMVIKSAPQEKKAVRKDDGLVNRKDLSMTIYLKPADAFWDELARCETASNWQDTGRFSGGLGIYNQGSFYESGMGTWERWGGEEFAPTPQEATRDEQIIVANRIAITGWSTTIIRDKEVAERHGVPIIYEYVKDPVGFYGWGALPCAGGKPKILYHYNEPDRLLLVKYKWLEKSLAVRDLQTLMGMESPSGIYDSKTRARHLESLKAWGLTKNGVPRIIPGEERRDRSIIKRMTWYPIFSNNH